ncbi:Uncharacterised protein [uncultured archaeon]|nr:Uncharacterised protein [uncultured archaeon]
MADKKVKLDSLLKGGNFCVKCGSEVPFDKVGHKCELISCPSPKRKKE